MQVLDALCLLETFQMVLGLFFQNFNLFIFKQRDILSHLYSIFYFLSIFYASLIHLVLKMFVACLIDSATCSTLLYRSITTRGASEATHLLNILSKALALAQFM